MTARAWADGFELDQVISELTTLVRETSPGVPVTEARHEGWTRLELSADAEADYSFSVAVYHDLEDLQLAADPAGTSEAVHFWCLPLERYDFSDFSEMLEVLKRHLRRILRHPTRIRQTRGWITWTFECEVMEGEWKRLYGHTCLRSMSDVPPLEGRERVYHGPNADPPEG